MKTLWLYSLVLCLTAQIGALQGANPHQMTISGTVSGATTAATVSLSGTLSGTQVTNSSGNYTFPNLVNGSYTITPSQSGYTFSPTSKAVTVSGNNSVSGVNFTATSLLTTKPTINSFTANPTSITSGSSSTLAWTTTNATSASINQSIGTVVVNGSSTVSPSVTTIYTLTATNSAGSITASATVTVQTAGNLPTISSFTATPSSITLGGTSTLAWTTSGATSLSIDQSVGTVTGTTSTIVTPSVNTTYTLTATNSTGSVTAFVVVMVNSAAPVINSFTASPTAITAGSSSTLSWNVSGATAIRIYLADGITNPNIATGLPAIGTLAVSPTVTSSYGLVANNAAGGVNKGLTVTVNASSALAYWKLDDATGTTAADSSGNSHAMTLIGTPAWQTSCVLNGCLNFNGTTQASSVALDLSGTNVITVDFWMKWTAFANDDKGVLEFSPNFNFSTLGFLILPDESSSGQFQAGVNGNVGYNQVNFTRPSAGIWHNYAFILNKGAPAATEVTPYVDGVAVSYSKPTSSDNTNNFGSSTLYGMSRAGTSLFGAGTLDEVYLYTRALSASEIANLASIVPPAPVQHTVTLAWTSSTSAVNGYNVKRATVSGGPYVQLNGALISGLGYSDATVNSGTTYYYVATAVSNGVESNYSNQVSSGLIP
jgi:Concanavalin A-like lectin/glucanases superfamily